MLGRVSLSAIGTKKVLKVFFAILLCGGCAAPPSALYQASSCSLSRSQGYRIARIDAETSRLLLGLISDGETAGHFLGGEAPSWFSHGDRELMACSTKKALNECSGGVRQVQFLSSSAGWEIGAKLTTACSGDEVR